MKKPDIIKMYSILLKWGGRVEKQQNLIPEAGCGLIITTCPYQEIVFQGDDMMQKNTLHTDVFIYKPPYLSPEARETLELLASKTMVYRGFGL